MRLLEENKMYSPVKEVVCSANGWVKKDDASELYLSV